MVTFLNEEKLKFETKLTLNYLAPLTINYVFIIVNKVY